MFIASSTRRPDTRAQSVRVHPAYPGLLFRPITSADHLRKAKGLMFFALAGAQEPTFGFYGLSLQVFKSQKGYPVINGGSNVVSHGNWDNAFQAYTVGGSGALQPNAQLAATAAGGVSVDVPSVVFVPAEVTWNAATSRAECALGAVVMGAMEIVAFGADNGQFLYTGFFGQTAPGDTAQYTVGGGALTEFVSDPVVFKQPASGPLMNNPKPDIALGWLSSFASIGTRRAGVEAKWSQIMADADVEVRKYLDKAKAMYVASPSSQRATGVNIITTWKWVQSTKRFKADFGFPSVLSCARMSRRALAASPTVVVPQICYPGGRPREVDLLLFTQPEVIRIGDYNERTWSDLMSGHRLADAMDFQSGKLLPGLASGSVFADAIRIVGAQFAAVSNGFVPTSQTIPAYVDNDNPGVTTWATLSNYSGAASAVYRGAAEACGPQVLADMHDAFTSIYAAAEDMAKADAQRKGGF